MNTYTCKKCEGAGKAPEEMVAAHHWATIQTTEHTEQVLEVGPSRDCHVCRVPAGSTHGVPVGHISRRQHSGWGSMMLARRYANTKAAIQCYLCKGTCLVRTFTIMRECFTCHGFGGFPAVGEPIPREQRCCHMPVDYIEDWLDELTIEVVGGADRAQSWNEHNLGIGCLWSVTDYGEWQQGTEEQLTEEVREDIRTRHHPQFTSTFSDREAGRVADTLLIVTNRSGYSVRPSAAERSAA